MALWDSALNKQNEDGLRLSLKDEPQQGQNLTRSWRRHRNAERLQGLGLAALSGQDAGSVHTSRIIPAAGWPVPLE